MTRILRALAVAVLSLSLTAPSQAYDHYSDVLDARGGDVYAGAYLTFRFGGPARDSVDDSLKYGFRAGLQMRQPGFATSPAGYDLTGRRAIRVNLLDTSFDSQGFKAFSFAGAPLMFRGQDGQIHVLGADGDKEEGKEGSVLKTTGKVLLWGGAILGGIIIVASLGSCVDGEPGEEAFLDFCPLN